MEINIPLKEYARLCALMVDTAGDESREVSIAEANGFSGADWKAAKPFYTQRMSDPADMGQTAREFMAAYQAAQADARGGTPPCTLEEYARMYAEVFLRTEGDMSQQENITRAVERLGHTYKEWLAANLHWAEVVGQADSPRYDRAKANTFGLIVQEAGGKP